MEFAVRDTGIGMTSEQLSRVFDAFVQADPSTSATYGGTGLGLALVSKIISDHGGWISADSVPGRTVFRVSLPMAPPTAPPMAPNRRHK